MAKKSKKHRKVQHKFWCSDGILGRHESKTEVHSWCLTCEGGVCPECHPNYYSHDAIEARAHKSRGIDPRRAAEDAT